MLQRLKQEKPWAKLRMSRRVYEAKRPWAKSGLSRKQWEANLDYFPDELSSTAGSSVSSMAAWIYVESARNSRTRAS